MQYTQKTSGGSNHALLPTGYFQRVFLDAPPHTLFGEVFGGGVIRVESTNSSHLTGPIGVQFPGELFAHTPTTVSMLRASGHIGRQWSPNTYASAIGNHPTPSNENLGMRSGLDSYGLLNWRLHAERTFIVGMTGSEGSSIGAPFGPWSIAAAEMRRLIRDARSRHPSEAFEIEGAILPGAEGDEVWRARASAARFRIERSFNGDGTEVLACVEPESGSPCPKWVADRLLAPATRRFFAVLMRRVLLQMPFPIIEETIGENRLVVCTCQ